LVFCFQAEDGIRVFHVTGVQTCALPISPPPPALRGPPRSSVPVQPAGSLRLSQLVLLSVLSDRDQPVLGEPQPQLLPGGHLSGRSEERRVGRECRAP